MRIVIDRIEDGFAVVELPSGETLDIPIALLPDVEEGDVFSIYKDDSEKNARQERIDQKMSKLFVD